jgi:hypothetical protein
MKKLIIGLVIGLTLGMSTNAFAAIGDTVQAVFAQFNYVVNAQTKTIDSPVLVYEGVSYLRTTDIGNMLGYDVTYKADSRTIEFNKPESLVTPASTPTPEPLATSSMTVATPTPDPSATPTPTPSETVTPSPTPTVTPTPTPSSTPTATLAPAPTPVPCQAIRDDYNGQIGMVDYEGGSLGQQALKVHLLEYERDQKLSAAGCN